MQLAFFGDSWVSGCEANEKDGWDAPEFAFASYFQDSVNLGFSGGSNDYFVSQLTNYLDKIDVAVFCLTEPSRRYWQDDLGEWINGNRTSSDLEHVNKHLVSLSNDVNDDRLTSETCVLLYTLCKTNNIRAYFVNMFGGQYCDSELWQLIPEDAWLLPRHTCIAAHCFDTQDWFPEFPTTGDFTDWLHTNNADVQQYIRPCEAHPNKLGHKAIAEFIRERINDL